MAPFVDFPIIFASALTKQRIFKVLETAKEVYLNRKAKIGTSKLNEVMLPLIEAYRRFLPSCSMPTCHSM